MELTKKRVFPKIILGILLAVFANFLLFAQKNYTIDAASSYKVSGTSSLHDWTMSGSGGSGAANITVDGTAVTAITSLSVQFNAEILKSGKNGMDKNAYKALKTTSHKTIKFVLSSTKKINTTTWQLTGNLTVGGVTKAQTIQVTSSSSGGKVTLKGSKSFNLTDYSITPPTALMGTVKTGNPVTISFTASFK